MTMMPSLPSKPSISTSIWFKRLLALVVTATEAGTTMPTDRIELIDEDDARRLLLRLVEHVTDAGCTDADKHLDEVGTGNRKERHLGFARNRFRQQGLTGTRRAHHQHALRNLAAEALELARVLEEVDDLGDFGLGFVDAGDVGKGNADLVFAETGGPCSCRTTWRRGHRRRPASGA